MISRGHKTLNEQLSAFQVEQAQRVKFIQEKEESLRIIALRNQEYIDNRTKELNDKEKSINDKRAAFERAYKQFEKQKLSTKHK